MNKTDGKFISIVDDNPLQIANFGERNQRVLVIRLPGGPDEWERIDGSRILLIGGEEARRHLRLLLDSSKTGIGRPTLDEKFPGGINSRTHTAMRAFCNL